MKCTSPVAASRPRVAYRATPAPRSAPVATTAPAGSPKAPITAHKARPYCFVDGGDFRILNSIVIPVYDDEDYGGADLPRLLSRAEGREVDELLALAELHLRCFSCGRVATFVAVGQSWCSEPCAHAILSAPDDEPYVVKAQHCDFA
jgi:hypothetical protein